MWGRYSSASAASFYDMFSDTSSSTTTTTTTSSEEFPGFIPIPVSDMSGDDNIENVWPAQSGPDPWAQGLGHSKAKMFQAYKGQMKLSVYVNYGLLTVHIVMAKHLKSKCKADCDTYVKVCLIPDDDRRTRCKTEVVHDTSSPVYDEKFSFELLEEDLRKRLLISVWHRDVPRNQCEFLGCMSFGVQHIQSQRKVVNGWYYLLAGEVGKKKHLQVSDKREKMHNRGQKHVTSVNRDVTWMEPHVVVIRRTKGGFGFALTGACPVKVVRVDAGLPAELAGLKKDDCIIRIDGLNVSRSSSDSVARIIRHAERKITLEVQRPRRHVETTFPVEKLDMSPKKPLCSSTPYNEEQTIGEMDVSPWKPGRLATISEDPERRTLFQKENRPAFETHDYGWLDGDKGYQGDNMVAMDMEPLPYQLLQPPPKDYGWIDGCYEEDLPGYQSSENQGPPPPYDPIQPPPSPQFCQKMETTLDSPWKPKTYDLMENNYAFMGQSQLQTEYHNDYVPMYPRNHGYEPEQPELEWDNSAECIPSHYETVESVATTTTTHSGPSVASSGYATLPKSMRLLSTDKYHGIRHSQPNVCRDDLFVGHGALNPRHMISQEDRYSTIPRKKKVSFQDFN